MQEESFKDTDTTKWIGKHILISVSISNLVKEPIFFCNSDPHHLVTSFIRALEKLALQSKAIMKNLFFDIKGTINIKLGSILEKLTQRYNQRERADLDDSDNETCTSTQFLQIQKKQLVDLQEHLERYCNVLPIFGFNSAKYDLKLIKSYLLPVLVNERNIHPTFIKKKEPVYLVQTRWYAAVGCYELSWRRNKSWCFLEGLQNFRDKMILPLGMVWSPRQNAEYRISPVGCFLQ